MVMLKQLGTLFLCILTTDPLKNLGRQLFAAEAKKE